MATLILTAAGAALGNYLLPAGLTVLGQTLSGQAIGGAVGSFIGGEVDRLLWPSAPARHIEGPRLQELQLQTSAEGAPIQRVFGRARLAGQVIWAANFKEVAKTSQPSSGGKGGGASTGGASVTEHFYYASFAVGLCEGVIGGIGLVWADGKPIDLSRYTYRIYQGTEDQLPDALIEAIEGEAQAPAYRGLAYIVFEDLPLEEFGNRVPQLNFEVFRHPAVTGEGMASRIEGVALIPGSGEFAYATDRVARKTGPGETEAENVQNGAGLPNLVQSLDQLAAQLPACRSVMLIVAWFGDDLRCGVCSLRPKVERHDKTTSPQSWRVDGIARQAALIVSSDEDGPLLGGTPSDDSIIQAIGELKARGYSVVFCPFILMDIPEGNARPSPYAEGSFQPAFPWRGRITIDPAPGVAGTPDATAQATAQVEAFFGTAARTAFAVGSGTVQYAGAEEWSYRRFVLHYAHLCAVAGGVDAFLLGSELKALTTVRGAANDFPAVEALQSLAGDVRAILGGAVKLGYAADWTEYGSYVPQDGSGDVYFPLDTLWADANIDFLGIDFYAPLSDWRDGWSHRDAALAASPADTAYLKANIEAGEAYDWYYADEAARISEARTPITDGDYGEPWIYRQKDLRNWWSKAHHPRLGGVRAAVPTPFVPQAKPIWFMETGCPAIDKGSNEPSVFYDPKSSESRLPYFSNGRRDDLIQRRFLEALLGYWSEEGRNPVSNLYGGPMIDTHRIHVWCWDARPFPDFPLRDEVWRDAAQWQLGHWLTGRAGRVAVGDIIAELCAAIRLDAFDVSALSAHVDGYVLDRIMAPRDAIEPLMLAFRFDAVETQGMLKFRPRGTASLALLKPDGFIEAQENGETYTITRAQEADLPLIAKLTFIESLSDFRKAAVEARRQAGAATRVAEASLAVAMESSLAQGLADIWLQEAWAARETVAFALPPSALALDPGDVLTLSLPTRTIEVRIDAITDAGARSIKATATDESLYEITLGPPRGLPAALAPFYGEVLLEFLDLPFFESAEAAHEPFIAAFAKPWPGTVALYRGVTGSSLTLMGRLGASAVMGETLTPLSAGPTQGWDEANRVEVRLYGGTLQSREPIDVLSGLNAAALRNDAGTWEIIQFRDATLVGERTWRLSGLLRGCAGSEPEMQPELGAGARFVLLNEAVLPLRIALDDLHRAFLWRYGPGPLAVSDPAFTSRELALSGLGLRPLSPVHVRAARDRATGDIRITWIRRTRIGGDNWEVSEVPLGETLERYEIDILDGSAVKRTVSADSPTILYTADQQLEDFGTTGFTTLSLNIAQLSELHGRGTAARRSVTLSTS
ncbi:MAG: glycoside hydrolase/phage tail family protein [Alphaproteobacteria bacterium]|nr:glycoside hydrolase/phage tail family protein [Alphaproteobacteria bacterium]